MKKFDVVIIAVSLIGLLLSRNFVLFLILLGLFLILSLLKYFASKNPQANWVQLLFGFHRPRTDAKNMTKKELYQSGAQFLLWSIFIFIILLVLGVITNKASNNAGTPIILFVLLFIILFLFMISLGGGLYLLFRGVIRRKQP